VQVDPIKLTLKAPVTILLTLKRDEPLSTFGFNFNSRRYTMEVLQEEQRSGRAAARTAAEDIDCMIDGRGLHSPTFQLKLSSSVHRVTQLNS